MILVAGFHITTLFIVVWLCFSGKLSNKIFHSNSKLTFLKHLASLPFDVLHFQIVHSSTKINIHVACDPNISNFRLQLSIQWNFTFFKQLHLKRTKLAVFFFTVSYSVQIFDSKISTDILLQISSLYLYMNMIFF